MAITNNGTRNSLPAAKKPTGYTSPTITSFTDWEYVRTLTLSVLKSTVEQAQVAAVAATGTVTCGSVLAADTVTVNGLLYTAQSGSKTGDYTLFDMSGTDAQTATDLADSITNDVRTGTLNDVTAASGGTAVVTCTSSVAGAAGNATTLVSSGATLAVSGAVFTSGADIVTSATGTMTDIFDDAVVGLDAQVAAIIAADFLASATVTTWAELTALTTNQATVSSGDGTWLTNTALSYVATVKLYVKTA